MTLAISPDLLDIRSIEQGYASPADVPSGLTGKIKRGLDLVAALSLLVFISPLLATIALLVRLEGKGPVLFRQTRCGRHGKAFTCFKFRTMRVDADTALQKLLAEDPDAAAEWRETRKLKNDPRITKLGLFLRRSSLDELPQLLNIIAGDMSVIGPRPVTFEELPRYGSKIVYYTAARPGVTGLWQVNGRNNLTYDERIDYDAEYARNWSLVRDLRIMIKTVPAVLKSEGAF